MDLTYISLEKKDRVAIAWLNKPKANTYDADLMRDLNTMIDDVRFDDDVDVCVIASKLDGVWSAGADINLLASSTPDYKAMFCLNCQEILNKMESTPKLFIAAIDGHCVGGGLEMPMYEGFALERELQNRLFAMADAKEGFRAFLEKRKPAFQGKSPPVRGRKRPWVDGNRRRSRVGSARLSDGWDCLSARTRGYVGRGSRRGV